MCKRVLTHVVFHPNDLQIAVFRLRIARPDLVPSQVEVVLVSVVREDDRVLVEERDDTVSVTWERRRQRLNHEVAESNVFSRVCLFTGDPPLAMGPGTTPPPLDMEPWTFPLDMRPGTPQDLTYTVCVYVTRISNIWVSVTPKRTDVLKKHPRN